MEPNVDPKNIVGSIIKAAKLLESFSADRREVTLGEFTRDVGLNKTTTYRLLQTLVTVDLLVRTRSGGYRLGKKVLYLGAIARADLDLRNEALPLMRDLTDEFGDTAFLMLPSTEGAVVIEALVGRNPVRVHGVTVGTVLPYHVAAGPAVIAAFDPVIEARTLDSLRAKMTPRTLTTKKALQSRYEEIRKSGYAISTEDYIDDVAAVGAPVLDENGIAIASLSLGGPANRFVEPLTSTMISKLQWAANELGNRMLDSVPS